MNYGRYNSEDKGDDAGQDIPAVAYARMSTDHQKYSTENQLDTIRNYATARGLQILRVFEDSGRSGLRLDGREALQNLMAEFRTGQVDFKAILVYDVSRWGRIEKEQDVVRRIYRMFVEDGRSEREIAEALNAEGHLTDLERSWSRLKVQWAMGDGLPRPP